MTQTLREKVQRLQRRQLGAYGGPQKGETRPGSMNDRKSAPRGGGKRTGDRIKGDSRNATR
jgi:hypothetical protein